MRRESKARALVFSAVCIVLYWSLQIVVMIFVLFVMAMNEMMRLEDPLAVTQEMINDLITQIMERIPGVTNSILLAAALLALLLIFLYLRSRRAPATERLWLYAPGGRFYLSLAGLGMAINVLFSLAMAFIPFPESWIQSYQSQVSDPVLAGSPVLAVLTSCLVVPLVEELIFRGLIFRRLMVNFSPVAALLLQTVLFAGFHLQPLQIIYVLPCSLLLGLVFLWRRSLIATIVVHMAFNATALLLDRLLQGTDAWIFYLFVVGCVAIMMGSIAQLYHTRERGDI